jgi:hypothetical protein
MNKTEAKIAQGHLDTIYDQYGPKLRLEKDSVISMTGSDHGYTQWTIAPVQFEDIDTANADTYGVSSGQVGMVVVDEADDLWYQIVAVGNGKVTTLQPIIVNPNDPRAPSSAEYEPVGAQMEGEGDLITIRRKKLRSDYKD